jgi:hypothetical protein
MYLQKVISTKSRKKFDILITEENSRIRIRIRIHQSGVDPRIWIRIQIRTKISWIRNTGFNAAMHLSISITREKFNRSGSVPKFHGSATLVLTHQCIFQYQLQGKNSILLLNL